MMHPAIKKILVGSSHSIIFLILDLCQSNSLTIFPEELFFPPYSFELETTFREKKKKQTYLLFLMNLPEDSSRKKIQLY